MTLSHRIKKCPLKYSHLFCRFWQIYEFFSKLPFLKMRPKSIEVNTNKFSSSTKRFSSSTNFFFHLDHWTLINQKVKSQRKPIGQLTLTVNLTLFSRIDNARVNFWTLHKITLSSCFLQLGETSKSWLDPEGNELNGNKIPQLLSWVWRSGKNNKVEAVDQKKNTSFCGKK